MMVLLLAKNGLFVSLECVDIVELLSTQSAKFPDASNRPSLSPEEVVVDALQISDKNNSDSHSKSEYSSR